MHNHIADYAAKHTGTLWVSRRQHRSHYTSAMAFIQSHGHFAAITKDGLLALSLEREVISYDTYRERGQGNPDNLYEAPMLFEVDGEGMVSSREVREWLGY